MTFDRFLRNVKYFFTRKPWWHSRKTNKHMKEVADRLIGYDKTVNHDWKGYWKYYIKREYPWCGLLQLTQFKVAEMRDYIEKAILCDEEIEKQKREMNEVLDLGWKILEDDYEKEVHNWYDNNSVSVTIVYENTRKKEKLPLNTFIWKEGKELIRLYNVHCLFGELFDKHIPNDEQKEFLKDKCTLKVKEWLAEQNKLIDEMNINLDKKHKIKHMTDKDITTAYTSEWSNGKSDKENHDYYFGELKKAWKTRQNDINKYFKLIAKYEDNWGD